MRHKKRDELGRVKASRETGSSVQARLLPGMVVTATNTICKQVDLSTEELSYYFQAFSTSVLHFGGFRRSYSISCTLYFVF